MMGVMGQGMGMSDSEILDMIADLLGKRGQEKEIGGMEDDMAEEYAEKKSEMA